MTKAILLPFTEHFILSIIKKTSTKYKFGECDKVCSFGSRTALREILPAGVFNKHILLTFEGREYRAPEGYDTYLAQKYGDYMTLPPVEKQVSTHDSQAYWTEQ